MISHKSPAGPGGEAVMKGVAPLAAKHGAVNATGQPVSTAVKTVVIPPPASNVSPPAPIPAPPPRLTPLQHVEAWWEEVKASAPPLHHKSFQLHIEEQWSKLVNRLEEK
jgi:hypothetical protein